ncbi:unnamed protein product [Fraxinus pennsylvanica]|uniref:Uncharacterized protein n=1 Tax=Fraxinus pennsylvanica TaxID=56036 RepID=A0AAD1ZLC5_9LAMI|nr:unnamed protein product [Fraxinus pennsylvanica]
MREGRATSHRCEERRISPRSLNISLRAERTFTRESPRSIDTSLEYFLVSCFPKAEDEVFDLLLHDCHLPVPASTDAKDIQTAAAEAAIAFGQPNSESSEAVSRDDIMEEAAAIWPRNAFFTDEEALFGMPGLIDNMADGLMLLPPYCMDTDNVEVYADVSLWSYSI